MARCLITRQLKSHLRETEPHNLGLPGGIQGSDSHICRFRSLVQPDRDEQHAQLGLASQIDARLMHRSTARSFISREKYNCQGHPTL